MDDRTIDLAAARAARAEAREQQPVIDIGEEQFSLPLSIRQSHLDAFSESRDAVQGFAALVAAGETEAGRDGREAAERFTSIDWELADLQALDGWLADVYPELDAAEGKAGAKSSLPRSRRR